MKLPRILVIDDEPSARMTTEAQLRAEAYDVALCAGGRAALDLLSSPPVDLVICDVMMPEVNGYDVVRAFKADPAWRLTPVLMLTANNDPIAIVTGLEAGADEFVAKPIEGPVLRARVRALLRMRTMLRAELDVSDARRAEIIASAGLTDREREVLELLLLGRTHEDIAVALGISERTSRFHQTNVLVKLGAESRLDLMRVLL